MAHIAANKLEKYTSELHSSADFLFQSSITPLSSMIADQSTQHIISANISTENAVDGSVVIYDLASVIVVLILLLIIVGTVIGNVLVCVAVCMVKKLRRPYNYLLVSLAFSDLCVAILVMPVALLNELLGGWAFGPLICDIWVSFDVLSCTASILNLCMISVDRYLAITKPLEYGVKRTPKRMFAYIAVVWIGAAFVSVPPVLILGNEHGDGTRCDVCQNFYYQIYATFASFYLPLSVMVTVYYKIFRAARRIVTEERRARAHLKQVEEMHQAQRAAVRETCLDNVPPKPCQDCPNSPLSLHRCSVVEVRNGGVNTKLAPASNLPAVDTSTDIPTDQLISTSTDQPLTTADGGVLNTSPSDPLMTSGVDHLTTQTTDPLTTSATDTTMMSDTLPLCLQSTQGCTPLLQAPLNRQLSCPSPSSTVTTCGSTWSLPCSGVPPNTRTAPTKLHSSRRSRSNSLSITSIRQNHSIVHDSSSDLACKMVRALNDFTSQAVTGAINTANSSYDPVADAFVSPRNSSHCEDSATSTVSINEVYSPKYQRINESIDIEDEDHPIPQNSKALCSLTNGLDMDFESLMGVNTSTAESHHPNSIQNTFSVSNIYKVKETAVCEQSESVPIINSSDCRRNEFSPKSESTPWDTPIKSSQGPRFHKPRKSSSCSDFRSGLWSEESPAFPEVETVPTSDLPPSDAPNLSAKPSNLCSNNSNFCARQYDAFPEIILVNDESLSVPLCNASNFGESIHTIGVIDVGHPSFQRDYRAQSESPLPFNFRKTRQSRMKFQLAKERKASTTLGIIMSAFIICWLPFFVLALVRPFLHDPTAIPMSISSLFLWLGYANSTLNPIIYATLNKDFRKPFQEILCLRCSSLNNLMREDFYHSQFGPDTPTLSHVRVNAHHDRVGSFDDVPVYDHHVT